VLERTSDDAVKAEIRVKMGAMSMTFKGTVEVAERDEDARRALLRVKSRDAGGQGYANADVTFALSDGGGQIHTAAQITGKAASMGEGVVANVLDALIKDFTQKLADI
jgi:carbon monoxide dehydrogenase subunit G